ncbi:MAG: EAL domain-containing protein, partial [Oscillospiraceae bacterium]
GFLSPADFIPLFEKNGFITDLDKYVWEKTCEALKLWRDIGYAQIPVSVNVSRVDIYNPHLPDILSGLVCKYQLPPSLLNLEITETAYTENPKQLVSVVEELKKRGFILEMDDFGSGYSSLNMLNDVPVDTLKLDMQFLQCKEGLRRNQDILTFIVHLAQKLNLSVIAEGIETQAELDFLKGIGCQYGQGYYFAKPMPISDFEIILKDIKEETAESSHRLQVSPELE